MENKNLPIYKLKIDDETLGVNYIALVDHPAIERNWMAFSKEKAQFEVVNKDLQIITGPLMIADLPIYRRSEERGEYYAVFDAETIEKIAMRYFKNKFTGNVNIMHDENLKVNDVFIFESFIINRGRGINPPKSFDGVTDGSWFGTMKVENNEVWEEFIKTGMLKGFSVEGEFSHEPFAEGKLSDIENIIEIISSIK
jgi:hypothetical protein